MTAERRDSGRPVVVITGFMGTGKSQIGRALADMIGLEFIDTDELIEADAGMSIARIFEARGETEFRKLEAATCETLRGRGGVVIATGGGTLLNEANFDLFSDMGTIVLLEASLDVLAARLSGDDTRPVLNAGGGSGSGAGRDSAGGSLREHISAILDERAHVYDRIDLKIDTSHGSPLAAATRIAGHLDLPHETMTVSFHDGGNTTDEPPLGRFGAARVDIGRGALSRLGRHLTGLGLDTRVFLFVPDNLRMFHCEQLTALMDVSEIPYSIITVADGDEHKHMQQAQALLDTLIDEGARRDSTIVTFGGGVTGDIGGFVASMFMRGIPYVQIPTTLLAQVDASIGGKVGVNHPLAKNIIGAFYQPHLILDDPCLFRTLPLSEISNGMAEVVKSAIIGSERFFEYLEAQQSHDLGERLGDITFLERCVLETARIKVDICNRDPYEKDVRRWMNLGHTLGHALEASGGYRGLKHGQAVSIGMIAALRLAVARGFSEQDLLDRTYSLLEWCGLPVELDAVDPESLKRSMLLDKKIKKGRLHFVLPSGLGACNVVDDVTVDEVLAIMEKG